MLSRFDWLRRSRTGAELLATLQHLKANRAEELGGQAAGGNSSSHLYPSSSVPLLLGPPPSALNGPCLRCWIYPRAATKPTSRYCPTCQAIVRKAWNLGTLSRHAVIVWGFFNQLPRQLHSFTSLKDKAGSGLDDSRILGAYVHDENHFLLALYHLEIKPWLQDLVIYHGSEMKGLIQIFPTTGIKGAGMGDLLCRIIHNEARFPMDRLRVRFFVAPHQIFAPNLYDRYGVLTFEITEFLNLLEMASVFRKILHPEEQENLYKLLTMENTGEAQFYWGRFLGALNQEARDMLTAWKIRQWSKPQINLFYELAKNVAFYRSR